MQTIGGVKSLNTRESKSKTPVKTSYLHVFSEQKAFNQKHTQMSLTNLQKMSVDSSPSVDTLVHFSKSPYNSRSIKSLKDQSYEEILIKSSLPRVAIPNRLTIQSLPTRLKKLANNTKEKSRLHIPTQTTSDSPKTNFKHINPICVSNEKSSGLSSQEVLQAIRSTTLLDYDSMRQFGIVKYCRDTEKNISRLSTTSMCEVRTKRLEMQSLDEKNANGKTITHKTLIVDSEGNTRLFMSGKVDEVAFSEPTSTHTYDTIRPTNKSRFTLNNQYCYTRNK